MDTFFLFTKVCVFALILFVFSACSDAMVQSLKNAINNEVNKNFAGVSSSTKGSSSAKSSSECPRENQHAEIIAVQVAEDLIFYKDGGYKANSNKKEAATIGLCLAYRNDQRDTPFDYQDPINRGRIVLAILYNMGDGGLKKNDKESKKLLNMVVNSKRATGFTRKNAQSILNQLYPSKKYVEKKKKAEKAKALSETPLYKLIDAYETYILIKKCHELNLLYINNKQMSVAKKKIKATENYYKKLGANTEKAWKLANTKPSKRQKGYLNILEIGSLSDQYNQGVKSTCNLVRIALPNGDPNAKNAPVKKDF